MNKSIGYRKKDFVISELDEKEWELLGLICWENSVILKLGGRLRIFTCNKRKNEVRMCIILHPDSIEMFRRKKYSRPWAV